MRGKQGWERGQESQVEGHLGCCRFLRDSENTDKCPLLAEHLLCAREFTHPLIHSQHFIEHLLWAWPQAETWEDK